MDIEKVRKLLDELAAFMDENELAELTVDVDGAEVKLRKAGSPAPPHVIHQAAPAAAPPAAEQADVRPETEASELEDEPGTQVVTSPMVGSFYRASKPDADPFIEVGDEVQAGETLCIIEAMKVMNEIKAEQAGRVTRILVDNGEPVEYGQPLFQLAVDE
ncbi:MAG: acetyl-CoA carboxylase biotin carboxyl carrier protein [Planctomycetota bacterium]